MIELNDVYFRYPKTDKDVICGLSCAFAPGECVAVTGRNGCGKTTLSRLITGILRPCAGSILVDGADTACLDLFGIGQRIGCVFQDPSHQLFCPTVREEIRYGLENMALEEAEIDRRAEYYMDFFRLSPLADAFPGTLSQGEKQRVILAAVLAMGTKYLVLDEPVSGLDIRAKNELGTLLTVLSGQGHGIIFISHERDFIDRYADRELVLT